MDYSITTIVVKDENGDLEHIRIKSEENGIRSSPDSSTDPLSCYQCGRVCGDETQLVDHLKKEHNIRVVSTTATGGTTRCPVCRKYVSDLSQHFAQEHAENNATNQTKTKSVSSPPTGATTRGIPIVLPSQPVPAAQLPGSTEETEARSAIVVQQQSRVGGGANNNGMSNSNNVRHHYIISPASSNNDNPVNLSVRKTEDEDSESSANSLYATTEEASNLGRKRRKQTHVPDTNKDERYWARRIKNNEAAKRSRDMRIRREKVIFEENLRLENLVKDHRSDLDKVTTENKELHLKLGIILDENARLKGLLQENCYRQEQH